MGDMIDFRPEGKMVDFKIVTVRGAVKFRGRYRRDLEKPGWHYYERDDGIILHFRKEHMVCVIGDTSSSFKKQKKK